MAKFLLLNRVTLTSGVELKAAKELDSDADNIDEIVRSGGVVIALPNATVEVRAVEVRKQESKGRREAELDLLAAAFSESIDALSARMLDPKPSVRASTVGDIALSGLQVVDAVVLADGDRVLVKNQLVLSQNGIYIAHVGAWERAPDANDSESVHPGIYVFVEEGFANAESGWVMTADGPIVVGTSPIAFSRFTVSGTGDVVAQVRNESGSVLAKGKLVTVVAYSATHARPIVDLADKDDPTRHPAVGFVFGAPIANNANGLVLIAGTLRQFDTSAFVINDQLVLGDAGNVLRSPPENVTFAGRVQTVGSVSRVDVADGEIFVAMGGARPDHSSILLWGNSDVGTTGTPRFLTPGYAAITAPTQDVQFDLPQDCRIDRMLIRARTGGTTGAQNIIYTLRVDNLDTALAVTMAATAQTGSNLVDSVDALAGSRVTVRVTKPGGIATSPTDVMCSMRIRAL